MAYPTISAPYGFKPVNLQGGRVYSGSTRMIPITMGYQYNLFNGDIVQLGNNTTSGIPGGTLAATGFSPTNAATTPVAAAVPGTLGVFVGCEYTNSSSAGVPSGPIYGKNRYQYWAGGTNANDAVGYVVDDPSAYFRVAVLQQPVTTATTTPGTTIGYMSERFVGTNAYVVTNSLSPSGTTTNYVGGTSAGSTATGDSGMGITGASPTVAGSGNLPLTTTAPFRIIQLVPDTAITVTTTNGATISAGSSSTVTVTSATGIQPGMQVFFPNQSATNARQGDYNYVVGVSGTTVTFANAITFPTITSGTQSIVFIGYPEVIVGWNFGYHSYQNASGV